jgi:hypothetical protein
MARTFCFFTLLLVILDRLQRLLLDLHITLLGCHNGLLRRQWLVGLARFSRLGRGELEKSHTVFMPRHNMLRSHTSDRFSVG